MSSIDRLWHRLRRPLRWRLTTRRLFLLALPAALPFWLAALLVLVLLKAFAAVLEPLFLFWSAPPRYSVGYHSYHRHVDLGRTEAKDLTFLVRRG